MSSWLVPLLAACGAAAGCSEPPPAPRWLLPLMTVTCSPRQPPVPEARAIGTLAAGGGTAAPFELEGSAPAISLEVEVAATPEAIARGLMFRRELPEGTGMLFVHPRAGELSFWMRNTQIPLSIAFISGEGEILEIVDMDPFDETSHRSPSFAQYALEVPRGWFVEQQLEPGDACAFSALDGTAVR